MPLITLAVPYSALSRQCIECMVCWAERSGESGGSGVPWEVKVVGADIKWLVGPSGLLWYFRRELDDMSKSRRREKCLGDDELAGWRAGRAAEEQISPIPLWLSALR